MTAFRPWVFLISLFLIASLPLDCFVIRANSELQRKLQLRYDNVILLSHKLILSRLSPRHTQSLNTMLL
jgi:hypothetical protein